MSNTYTYSQWKFLVRCGALHLDKKKKVDFFKRRMKYSFVVEETVIFS